MDVGNLPVANVVNVKVDYIRPTYQDLRVWMSDPNNVYIGRKGIVLLDDGTGKKSRYPTEDSPFANPYKINDEAKVIAEYNIQVNNYQSTPELVKQYMELKEVQDLATNIVLEKYQKYILERLNTEPGLFDLLMSYRGKNLGCWCKPEPCHGDILVAIIAANLDKIPQETVPQVPVPGPSVLSSTAAQPSVPQSTADKTITQVIQEHDFPFMKYFLPPASEMLDRLGENLELQTTPNYKFDGNQSPVIKVSPLRYYMTDAVANHFTEDVRIKCNRNQQPSPYEVYQQKKGSLDQKFKDKSLEPFYKTLTSDEQILFNRRENLYSMVSECNNFNTTLCYYILKALNAKNVLDPSAGWGDRALASIAYGIHYVGFDPNIDLAKGYGEITQLANSRNVSCQFFIYPFDQLSDDELNNLGYFSTVITSPPYFDLEIYSGDESQSVKRYPTYQNWVDGFLKKYVNNAFDRLEENGNFAIYIEDVREMKLTEEVSKIMQSRSDAIYRGVIGFTYGRTVRPTFIWSRSSSVSQSLVEVIPTPGSVQATSLPMDQILKQFLSKGGEEQKPVQKGRRDFVIEEEPFIAKKGEDLATFQEKLMYVHPDSPRMPYRRRKDSIKTSIHWGQRKLMMSEIQALSEVTITNPTVVYVGAASGVHIPFLSDLFPDMKFYLYDPAEFKFKKSKKTEEKIVINYGSKDGFFTTEIAKMWANRSDVVFISDIRGKYEIIPDHLPEKDKYKLKTENDKVILANMKDQMEWHKIIKPHLSSLKFRLPYFDSAVIESDVYRYLDGYLLKQVWPGESSTECRLIVLDGSTAERDYSLKQIEDVMFFHNAYIREDVRFINPLTQKDEFIDGNELTQDYDSSAEAVILQRYLQRAGKPYSPEDVIRLSREITARINSDAGKPKGQGDSIELFRKSQYKSSGIRYRELQKSKVGAKERSKAIAAREDFPTPVTKQSYKGSAKGSRRPTRSRK